MKTVEIELNEKQIAEIVDNWFAQTDFTVSRFWQRNKVAVVIQSNLDKLGKWPRRKRTKPNKIESNKIESIPMKVVDNDF
jgi:hypothetical protein